MHVTYKVNKNDLFQAYMFHGVSSTPVSVPDSLYPTPLSQYDPNPTLPIKTENEQQKSEVHMQGKKPSASKKAKKKKGKKPAMENDTKNNEEDNYTESTLDTARGQGQSGRVQMADNGFRPAWSKISSSESDYSDTEGGQGSRLRSSCAKVRQCALGCLHATIKVSFTVLLKRFLFQL